MDGIRGFIISLCTVSAASAVMNSVIGDDGMKKYVNYIMTLALVLFFVSPIKEIVGALPEAVAEIPQKYGEGNISWERENADYIHKTVCEKFTLAAADVYCCFTGDTVNIRIRKKPGIVSDDVKLFVEERYGVNAEVVLYE